MKVHSHPDRLHGMLIANASLLKSLVSVLPLEALQALLPELERDTEFACDYLLGGNVSDTAIATYEMLARQNLDFVRDQLRQKEMMQSHDGGLRWTEGQRPTSGDG